MVESKYKLLAKVTSALPPFYQVAEAVWGKGVNIDSDGDSYNPESTTWRELTISLRPLCQETLDIDPVSEDNNTIRMVATSKELLESAYNFLHNYGSIERIDI